MRHRARHAAAQLANAGHGLITPALEIEAPRPVHRRATPDAAGPEQATPGPLGAPSLLSLQRSAGNAAVCARLGAEPVVVSPQAADKKTIAGGVEEGGMEIVDSRVSPLQRNGGATVTDPPTAQPTDVDAGKPAAAVTVTVPPHVRGAASPATMADRIPPRVNTLAHVDISGLKPGDPAVELSVTGTGGGNGTVTIDGAATKSMSASGDVNLQGGTQTDAGKGGALKLVAKRGGAEVATSGGFSVSSIPQNYSDTFVKLITGGKRGIVVQDGWESDSGVVADLNETEIAEQVEVTSATGCFSGTSKSNSGYLAGDQFSQDQHGTPVAVMTKAGNRVAQQTCMFKDKRAGSTDIPMTKSGYTLVRDVRAKDKSGALEIQTTKNGASTTANGVTSGAGSGSIDKTQDV